MTRSACLSTIILASLLLAALPVAADEPREPGRFRFDIQQGIQAQRSGLGTAGGFAASFGLHRHLHVDAGLRYGGVFPLFGDYERQFYVAGVTGLALSSGADPTGWEFRLAGRYVRLHHAELTSWGRTFFANLAGTGTATGAHGGEVAVGMTKTAPQGFDFGDLLFSIGVRAGYFPASEEMNWTAALVFSAGFRLYRD